jgi:PTS system nitrogen regulatory IIA component
LSADPLATGVDPRLVFPDLEVATREDALRAMAQLLTQAGVVKDAGDLARRLIEREVLGCTGLGGGIAIPHCKLKDLNDIVLSIGRCRQAVDFHAPDGIAVRILFLILSPAQAPALHLQALARVSRWLKAPGTAEGLLRAETREEILEAVRGAQTSVAAVLG